jgi:hypothetical protein
MSIENLLSRPSWRKLTRTQVYRPLAVVADGYTTIYKMSENVFGIMSNGGLTRYLTREPRPHERMTERHFEALVKLRAFTPGEAELLRGHMAARTASQDEQEAMRELKRLALKFSNVRVPAKLKRRA